MPKQFIVTYPNKPYGRQYYQYTFSDGTGDICFTPYKQEAGLLEEQKADAIVEELLSSPEGYWKGAEKRELQNA